MMGLCLPRFLPVALLAAGLAVPSPGWGQDVAAPCQLCATPASDSPNARPATPLRLQVETRLDFDRVVFDGQGSALIALSPDGVARMTGAATATGARAMPGSVLIRGEPGRPVRIELPRQVELTGDGSNSVSLTALTTDLPAFPRIGDDGTLSFRFGGDLRLQGDADGAFRGTIDIMVDYL